MPPSITRETLGTVEVTTGAGFATAVNALDVNRIGGPTVAAAVDAYELSNRHGMRVRVLTLGARVQAIHVPDHAGAHANVVLGLAGLAEYAAPNPYLGAVAGRYANRIAGGCFALDGNEYRVPVNDPPNSLHGGGVGFDKCVWDAEPSQTRGGPRLTLRRTSPHGEMGYPARLDVRTAYTLTDAGELVIDFEAANRDASLSTVVNLTNHSYFNLAGEGSGDVLDHRLQVFASRFAPVDRDLIPTGDLQPVDGTPMDFRASSPIGERIGQPDAQLELGTGYDHSWVIDRSAPDDGTLVRAARLIDPRSGRVLEVFTTEPDLHFYSGNRLDGSLAGPSGAAYGPHTGLCLETQHFPDSPNQPGFPSTTLPPGQVITSRTVFRFSTQEREQAG